MTPKRLSGFSDGVFAVLITVLVLELRPLERPTFDALLALWPAWPSYAVSYLFIVIVWTNHHYVIVDFRGRRTQARGAGPRLRTDQFVTACGRLCLHRKRIIISTVLAGRKLGIKEVDDGMWLVSFMHYDLGYFDLEQKTLQPLDNPFGTRLSPMS